MAGQNLRARMPESSGAHTYYVDATNGSDTNLGTLAAPFKTITKAESVVVSGDFVYLRSHQGQVYRPAPGKKVFFSTTSQLTFQEPAGVTGIPMRIRMRTGASLVVNVYGNDIDIVFVSGTSTANAVASAVNTAYGQTICTGGGVGTAMTALNWTSGSSHAVVDAFFAGAGEVFGVHSHEIYVGGNLGATPPGTANPITIETYPADYSIYGAATVSPRAGYPSGPTPKNETGSDGVTAATLLGSNVPGGTGSITLVKASHWPNQGSFTLGGITGVIHYTGRTGDTLTGLHDGGTAITGTVSASGLATYDANLSNTYAFTFRNPAGTFPDGHRLRNLKITGSTGNRSAGVSFDGNGSTDGTAYCELYGCELTGHYYQAFQANNASNNIYLINLNCHDNGTGQQSTPSNLLTAPDSQQHNGYLEGNNNNAWNCVFRDAPWGSGLQSRVAGTGLHVVHCTIVHNGYGAGAAVGPGVLLDFTGLTAVIKNNVITDNFSYCFHDNAGMAVNAITEDHNILSKSGVLDVNHNYYATAGGNGTSTAPTWCNEAGGSVTKLTVDDVGFVNYTGRNLRPVGGSSIVTQAVDTSYSPTFDITGNPRINYTAGAYEYAPNNGCWFIS